MHLSHTVLFIYLSESGELERQLADSAFLDYLSTLESNDNSCVFETPSANNHTADTTFVEHASMCHKWTPAEYGYSSTDMKSKKRKSEEDLDRYDSQKYGHNCSINDMEYRPSVISSTEHDLILVGRYS